MKEIQSVLVLGAGVMGKGIAQHIAAKGFPVTVYSRTAATLDKCRALIGDSLANLEAQDRATPEDNVLLLGRISYTTEMESNAPRHDLVIETISENYDLKRNVFHRLDALCPPETILVTNTSSFDINDLADVAEKSPERVMGMHWFHPPNITPGIEVIPTSRTSPAVVETIFSFCRALDKLPTRCASAPGFVANRIQMAMAAEALKIVAEDLATPEEVDAIVRSTFGFRLGAFGPFEILDMAGTDTYLSIMRYMREKLGWNNPEVERILSEKVEQGCLGLKNGKGFYEYDAETEKRILTWRDNFLARRLEVFEEENRERES